jgi:hypothetical protein
LSTFTVVRDDILRVSIHVPQTLAMGIRDGLDAKVLVFDLPGQTFAGKVARSAVHVRNLTQHRNTIRHRQVFLLILPLTIMVPKANPAKITGLADLGEPNVRLAMPNPEFEGIARSVDSPGFTADIISKAPPIETGAFQLSWQLVCKLA